MPLQPTPIIVDFPHCFKTSNAPLDVVPITSKSKTLILGITKCDFFAIYPIIVITIHFTLPMMIPDTPTFVGYNKRIKNKNSRQNFPTLMVTSNQFPMLYLPFTFLL